MAGVAEENFLLDLIPKSLQKQREGGEWNELVVLALENLLSRVICAQRSTCAFCAGVSLRADKGPLV